MVPSATLPVFANTANAEGNATYRTFFRATVPGLGVQTYFLSQASEGTQQATEATQAPVLEAALGKHQSRFSTKAVVAADQVLENDGVAVTFDGTTGLIKSVKDKASSMEYDLAQSFAWYPSYQVDNEQDSGAYIFRPAINGTNSLAPTTKLVNLVNTPVVSEAWQQVTPWLTQIIRLRAGARGIEFEWTVGPIPVDDGQGKEIIIRFNSTLASKGTFYTDSSERFARSLYTFAPHTGLLAAAASSPASPPLSPVRSTDQEWPRVCQAPAQLQADVEPARHSAGGGQLLPRQPLHSLH